MPAGRSLHEQSHGESFLALMMERSPILMAYPDASIFHSAMDGIEPIAYQDTERYQVTREFLLHPQRMLEQLLAR